MFAYKLDNGYLRRRELGSDALLTHQHWKLLKQVSDISMSPQEFISHWHVTQEQLAKIADCSLSEVKRWFTQGKTYKQPPKHCKMRLAVVHRLWSKI